MPYFTVHLLCQQATDGQARQALKTLAAMTVNLLVTMKAGSCLTTEPGRGDSETSTTAHAYTHPLAAATKSKAPNSLTHTQPICCMWRNAALT